MYQKWISLKEQINKLTEELHNVEADIWLKANDLGQINPSGSKTFDVDGFKVTITHRETVTVDQEKAKEWPDLFNVKYEFSKSKYKSLIKPEREFVDEIITIKPGKPGFKVEAL